MRRSSIRSLYCDAIDSKPRDADWTVGYGETWECAEATRCEKCGKAVVGGSGDRHRDYDASEESNANGCDGRIPEQEGPMMSYWYPLAIDDVNEAARLIVDLPLVVVTVNGETGLALSGGGMNLQWQICEAFMLLGFLPPVHFADVPAMCGRGVSARDRWIVAGCVRSCVVTAQRAKSTAQRARDALAFGVKHEAERKAKVAS